MSTGLVVTPCKPVDAARFVPAFGLDCPPPTHNHPNRNSLIQEVLKACVQAEERLSVCVFKSYPKPGRSVSLIAPNPKGLNWFASKMDTRTNTLSLPEKV